MSLENEDLQKLLTFDPNADEKEIEALYALVLLGLIAEADEKIAKEGEADPAVSIANANAILKAVYEGCQANETLAAAVKATDSKLYDMLEENNKHIKEYVEKNGVLTVVQIEVDEKSYAEFEAEIKKLEDYLKGIEGKKQGALDLLALLHAVMDDIHGAIDGHTHEDTKKQAAAFAAGAAFGMNMQDVIAAIGRTDYEIDQEHTHGPVTFTELECEHVSVDGKRADEHYLFAGDELVAIRICFEHGITTFDQVVADLSGMYGEAADVDLAVLANGIYAVDDDGKLEGKAAAIVSGNMMVVIEEDKDEVEVTYIDLTAAYILAA